VRHYFRRYEQQQAAYFVEKLVIEISYLGGLSSKRGLHSG